MKILSAALVPLAALALAQSNRGTFRNSDVAIEGYLRSGRKLDNGGFAFSLYGGVVMTAEKAGLRISANSVTGETLPRKNKKASALRKGQLAGNVVATRTLNGETSVLKGSRAIIDSPDGLKATILLFGPVSFASEGTGGRSILATGNRGSADIAPDAAGDSAIRGAAISGNVRVTLDQAPVPGNKEGAPPGRYVATGNRAVLAYGANGSTVTLTGNVRLSGTGENVFQVEKVAKVVIRRNLKGEATGIDFDGGGGDTETTITPGKKKG